MYEMARKYLPGGALNPIWCDEQDAEREKKYVSDLVDLFMTLSDGPNVNMDLEMGDEGVHIKLSGNKVQKVVCQNIDSYNDYEEKFEFLKTHSDTPEDLELAMKIIGLK